LKDNVIVKRYGYALFSLYKEKLQVDRLKDVFGQFIETLNQHGQIYVLLNSPIISRGEKIELLNHLMQKTKVEKLFLNFLSLLVANDRFKYVFNIYSYILDLYNEENNTMIASLYVTDKPDNSILEQLRYELERIVQYKIMFDIKIKKDILGGFVIVMRDKIIDVSIRKTLNEIVLNVKGEI
jgi:F-type H+-transporting ATPase subunit delta